jgi:hypothetical protein
MHVVTFGTNKQFCLVNKGWWVWSKHNHRHLVKKSWMPSPVFIGILSTTLAWYTHSFTSRNRTNAKFHSVWTTLQLTSEIWILWMQALCIVGFDYMLFSAHHVLHYDRDIVIAILALAFYISVVHKILTLLDCSVIRVLFPVEPPVLL